MDEYIKREAAENAIRNDLPLSTWMKRSVDKALNAMGVTVATIDAIPAADVAPVVHGRWINDGDEYRIDIKCERCRQRRPILLGNFVFNYCPNCGAKMDGGANDV